MPKPKDCLIDSGQKHVDIGKKCQSIKGEPKTSKPRKNDGL